jgi:glycosyltransferase involved in cell wall biosynthesis
MTATPPFDPVAAHPTLGRPLRVLHVHHALYIPTLVAHGMRALGAVADTLHFDPTSRSRDLTWSSDYELPSSWRSLPRQLLFMYRAARRYDVFHFWARPYLVPATYSVLQAHKALDLAFLRRRGRKIVYQSDGCYIMVKPSTWKREVDPQVCFVCQTTQGETYGFCSNANTDRLSSVMSGAADLIVGTGMDLDYEQGAAYVFSPVDLTRWYPRLEVPAEYRYTREDPDAVLVYHGVGSHVIGTRGNIKGTAWIREAVAELRAEGIKVELMHVENIPNAAVRFFQVQADVVVDQLLVGGGGQNARECLALGKPVLTRVFGRQHAAMDPAAAPFPRAPFVETDVERLRIDLRRFVLDAELRARTGAASAAFARAVLSPEAAARRYLGLYQGTFATDGTS